jgi:hypothetical protein
MIIYNTYDNIISISISITFLLCFVIICFLDVNDNPSAGGNEENFNPTDETNEDNANSTDGANEDKAHYIYDVAENSGMHSESRRWDISVP